MATAPSVTYRVGAGASVNAGRWPGGRAAGGFVVGDQILSGGISGAVAGPPATYATVGDSLYAFKTGSDVWSVGLNGGKLKRLVNAAVAGNFVHSVNARIDNNYLLGDTGGLAGLPEALGYVFLRIGTNDSRSGETLDSGTQTSYTTLFGKLLTYCQILVVQAIPPATNSASTVGAWNTWLSAQCDANPTRMKFMNDCAGLYSSPGVQNAVFFDANDAPNLVHFSPAGVYEMARAGQPILASILAPYIYTSPVTADPLDVYPAQPQWHTNPANTGSTAVTGGYAGNWVDGLRPYNIPTGFTATASVVAADGGDAITAPWQRLVLTAIPAPAAGPAILRSILAGRTVTSGDPVALRTVMQLRFTNVNPAALKALAFYIQGQTSFGRLEEFYLFCGAWPGGLVNGTVTLNIADPRQSSNAESALHQIIEIRSQAALTGAIGTIDMRCLNIRG
jgi:hypothetical protein